MSLAPTHLSAANAGQIAEIGRFGDGALRAVSWSPDDRRLWISTSIGIYEYDPVGMQRVGFRPLPLGDRPALLDHNGRLAAVTISETRVQLQDTATEQVLHDLDGVKVLALAFSPDDGKLATIGRAPGEAGDVVVIWDTHSGRQLARLVPERSWNFEQLAFSPDGRRLAAAGRYPAQDAALIQVWDVDGATLVGSFEAPRQAALTFRPEGRAVLWDGKEWDVETGQPSPSPAGELAHWFALSPDGARAATLAPPKAQAGDAHPELVLQVWDVSSGRVLWQTSAPSPAPMDTRSSFSFSPMGRWVSYVDTHKEIQVWDANTGERAGSMVWPEQLTESLSVSRDGRWVAWTDGENQVHVVDLVTGAPIPVPVTRAESAAFGLSGQLATCERDALTLWSIEPDVHRLLALAGPSYRCTRLAFGPDGRLLAAGTDGRDIVVWDMAARRRIEPLRGHSSSVADVAFSRDGSYLASAGNDGTVRFWRASDLAPLVTFATIDEENVAGLSVAIAPDSHAIAFGTSDGLVHLWDKDTGRQLHQLTGLGGSVHALAFSPDGEILAAGSEDGRIHLWDPLGGGELTVLAGHQGSIRGLVFTPDGSRLLSASGDGTVREWGLVSQ